MAAVDYFLKIDGIDGESVDAQHKGEIDVESWSWGETHASQGAGGGGGAGKVVRQDFHFVVHTGKQSPKLMLACATGQHIKTGVLTVRKSGGDTQLEFLKFQLGDVLVSSYNIGATQVGGDPAPRDSFSLNFVKIAMTETSQSPSGAPGTAAAGGFDFQINQVVANPGT